METAQEISTDVLTTSATCMTVLYSSATEWWRNYSVATRTAEAQVKEWLDMPQYRVTRGEADKSESFRLVVELPKSTVPITITQSKEDPAILHIIASVKRDSHMEEVFSRLGVAKAEIVRDKMYLELLRAGINFDASTKPDTFVTLWDQIVFDRTLTQRSFLQTIFKIQTATLAAIAVFQIEKNSLTPEIH